VGAAGLVALVAGAPVVLTGPAAEAIGPPTSVPGAVAGASTGPAWPGYLDGPQHHSYAARATAITPTTASTLHLAWSWMPDPPPDPSLGEVITASPTVVGGVVYLGANNGTFYALSEATGSVIWRHFVGYVVTTDPACGSFGFASTATVAPDPSTGALTVYVAAADGYLYAFDAATGATDWRSVIGLPTPGQHDYFAWSSPEVAGGEVYVGIASMCDRPLVRGGLLAFQQSTGAQTGAYYDVPPGSIGGSVWSSPAVAGQTVYIATGNGPASDPLLGTSESIVALRATTLTELAAWQIPTADTNGVDSDFGASPTLLSATLPGGTGPVGLLGVCNKSGWYFMLHQGKALAAGPVWQAKIGKGNCLGEGAWDGHNLYLAATSVMVNGTTVPGSVRQVDPATGAVGWVTPLTAGVLDGVSADGGGVLAVSTYQGAENGAYVFNAATGALVASLNDGGSPEAAQPVFAGPYLFTASDAGGLRAYTP
jgi:outer membrane protein assembly factor BamB